MKRNNTIKNLENDMNGLKTTLIACKRISIKLAGLIAHHRFPQSCSQALLDTQRVCTAILDTNILQKKRLSISDCMDSLKSIYQALATLDADDKKYLKCHFGRYFLALDVCLQLMNSSAVVKTLLFFNPWLSRGAKLVKALAVDEDVTLEQITNELFGKSHSKTADAVATTPVAGNHTSSVAKTHAKRKHVQHAAKQVQHIAMHDTLAPSFTVPTINANQEQANDARCWQVSSSIHHEKADSQANTHSEAKETDTKQASIPQPTVMHAHVEPCQLSGRGLLYALGMHRLATGMGSWLWQRSCLWTGQWLGSMYHEVPTCLIAETSPQSTGPCAGLIVQKYARRYVIKRQYVAMRHAACVLQAQQRGKKTRALVHAQRHIATTPLKLTVRYRLAYSLCMACARIACRIPWLSNYFREAARRCALDTASSALVKQVQSYRAVEYILRPIKPIASPVTTVYSDQVAYTQLADCLKVLQTHHDSMQALHAPSCRA